MTPAEFWAEANGFGQRNRMDGILAYMYTMLREAARRNRPFTRADLVEKGRSIVLFPGWRTGSGGSTPSAPARGPGGALHHLLRPAGDH